MATIETTVTGNFVRVTCEGQGAVDVDVAAFPESLLLQAAIHGVKQKLVDAAALSRDTTTGKPATPAEKFARVKGIAERLNVQRLWNAPAGERAVGGGMLLRAAQEAYPGKFADGKALKAWMDGKKIDAATFKTFAKVKPILARMEAEAARNVDTAAMEAELDS